MITKSGAGTLNASMLTPAADDFLFTSWAVQDLNSRLNSVSFDSGALHLCRGGQHIEFHIGHIINALNAVSIALCKFHISHSIIR